MKSERKLAKSEAIIERGLPEVLKVADAIDRLSPLKINKDLEIETNRLFIAFISDLSATLKKAVARIVLRWAKEYSDDDNES